MSEKTTSISITELKKEVKGSLAMMGKRLSDKDGKTMFTSVTLSNAEETYLNTYLKKGVALFLGEFAPRITGYTKGDSITITFHSTRVNDSKIAVFEENLINYVVAYMELKVFGLSLTEEARKNEEAEMQAYLSAASKLFFSFDPPSQGTKTLLDMTGEVILN